MITCVTSTWTYIGFHFFHVSHLGVSHLSKNAENLQTSCPWLFGYNGTSGNNRKISNISKLICITGVIHFQSLVDKYSAILKRQVVNFTWEGQSTPLVQLGKCHNRRSTQSFLSQQNVFQEPRGQATNFKHVCLLRRFNHALKRTSMDPTLDEGPAQARSRGWSKATNFKDIKVCKEMPTRQS